MKSFKISNPKYPCLRAALLYGLILLFATQLINCNCKPNEKKPLTSFSELKLGSLHMQVNPTELIGNQQAISITFTPTNEQIVFLDRYNLTIQVEDRAGVINWDSEIWKASTKTTIKTGSTPLNSFSLFHQELNPADSKHNTFTIDLLIHPAMGSRQIVIKFQLCNTHGVVLQQKAVTWCIDSDEPTPNPEDPIDPTAVIKRKINPTPTEKIIEEEILRKQRERDEEKRRRDEDEEEKRRREEEIRKKRGEEWLRGEGKKWQRYWERDF